MAQWKRVVAGFDNSDHGTRALRCAGDLAKERGLELVVVNAWEVPTFMPPMGTLPPDSIPLELTENTKSEIRQAVQEALADSRPATVNVVFAEGSAAKVLTDFVDSDDVLVVGSRGRGGFAGLLLGSVSQHAVTNAPCTVVVVR